MRKSIYLNAKEPLYTTRNNIGCVAFKAQSKERELKTQEDIQHSKKIVSLAQQRINWISNAYDAVRDRMTNNLLTSKESQCLQTY